MESGDQDLQRQVFQLDAQIEVLRTPTLSGTERERVSAKYLADLAHLSSAVKNASARLPAYDQRHYSDAIKILKDKFEGIKATSAPKRKFAFKNKAPDAGARPTGAEPLGNALSQSSGDRRSIARDSGPVANDCSVPAKISYPRTINISGPKKQRIVLPPDSSNDDQASQLPATIDDVQECTVDLRARSQFKSPLAKLQVSKGEQSLIVCGHVSGSVFLSESRNCVLLVTCGQLRLYNCRDCTVYLSCISKPVIELSDGIRFAPLPTMFINADAQHPNPNTWDQVEDFNWLHTKPNPHWSVIPGEDRVPEKLWEIAIDGKGGQQSLRDILAASN